MSFISVDQVSLQRIRAFKVPSNDPTTLSVRPGAFQVQLDQQYTIYKTSPQDYYLTTYEIDHVQARDKRCKFCDCDESCNREPHSYAAVRTGSVKKPGEQSNS